MSYIKVEIHGKLKDKFVIEGFLAEKEIFQFEEVSHDVIQELGNKEFSWDYVDPVILDVDQESLILRLYLDQNDGDLLDEIRQGITSLDLGQVLEETIEEEDWANNWKEFFHPIRLNSNLTIVPTWEDYKPLEGEKIIYMDPGMAFGSGSHETTFMCMTHLLEYVELGDLVFDIGCGSGILSLVAASAGARKVIGVDLDPVCISASNQNVSLNNMEDRVEIFCGDLFQKIQGQAEVIVSNLFAEVIIGMLDSLVNHLVDNGIFIASGILQEKKEEVILSLESKGFIILDSETKGDWACIVARLEK